MPGSDREQYWRSNWYSKLIGSVNDGHVSADVEGVPDLTAERRAEYERQAAEAKRREAEKPRQLKIELR